MNTSELVPGTVIKFKNCARLHLFYEKDFFDYMKTIDVGPGKIATVLKTAVKDNHVGQTLLIDGSTKIVYYMKNTFFDENKGCIGEVDVTLGNFYYDVIA